jgi:trans-L-3-hydroxyproline dehydratase
MLEPRGHADMYGGWLGPPVSPGADISVLFLHNDGFSTMCGHGIIALTKVILDMGVLPTVKPETTITIDTPAGPVTSTATLGDHGVETVSFLNVPSFVAGLDQLVDVEDLGQVRYDLAFGGAYYAYVGADSVGLPWPPEHVDRYIDAGRRIKRAITETTTIEHPGTPELGFLYGVIFSGPPMSHWNMRRNVCVFADGEVDRSPTGTGVSGHLAIDQARGRMDVGDQITVESIVGSEFTGSIAGLTTWEGRQAVIPRVSGSARITGRSEFWYDPEDRLSQGFLLR